MSDLARKSNYREETLLDYFGEVLFDLVHWRKNRSINIRVLINQILFTGVEALFLVGVNAIFMGALVVLAGHEYLGDLGQKDWIYQILVMVVVRDVCPVVVAFIILLRSGTAITTELGNMKVNKEIDALQSIGVSPVSYLVAPRIFGMIFSMVLLAIYFMILGLLGGYLAASLNWSIPFSDFFRRFAQSLMITDLLAMVLKAAMSGLVIGSLCSFHGLRVKFASTEVPQRTIKSVTQCVLAVMIVSGISTILYFGIVS